MNQLRLTLLGLTLLFFGCDASSNLTADANDSGVVGDAIMDSSTQSCDAGLSLWFDLNGGQELSLYPSDRFTAASENTPTGLHLSFDGDRFPWFANLPQLLAPDQDAVETFSGFAHNGGVLIRFKNNRLPTLPNNDESLTNDNLIWLDLSESPAQRIPFRSNHTIDETGIILDPLTTLRPGHRYAVIVKKTLWSEDTCFEPNNEFKQLLSNTENLSFGDARFAEGVGLALSELQLTEQDIVGATTFTTHMDHLKLKAVADEVLTRNYTWLPDVSCEDTPQYEVCEVSFKAWDFRDPKMIITTETQSQWTLIARIFLPLNRTGPLPVLLYGHGLNSGRTEADQLADEFSENGDFALVALDSLMHGDHPTRLPDSMIPALDFLGVKITEARVDGAAMHGNFTQTVVDRLQLLQLIRRQPDFDGDGIDDFDPSRIGYFGVSLGGMLGSLFLANTHNIPAAVMSISGGRLIQFLSDIPQLEPFRPALNNLAGGEVKAERVILFAQTLVDSADPATFAQFILKDRLYPDSTPPHLLMPVADQDDTVPPETGYALARSLGVPHVGPVITEVFGLEQQATPAADNTDYGVTAGYFQFDRISNDEQTEVKVATHAKLPPSPEALLQTRHFLTGWLADETPEIINPYEQLNTPQLDEDND